MKKYVLISVLCLFVIVGNACSYDENITKEQLDPTPIPMVNEAGRVTAEYVLQNSSLTVEDIRGVPLNDLLNYYAITPEVFEKTSLKSWIEKYKKTDFYIRSNKLDYLIENPAVDGKYVGGGEDIYLVVLHENHGNSNHSWLYNFEKNEINYADDVIFDKYVSFATDKSLDEQKKLELKSLIDKNVPNWERVYDGEFEAGSTYSFAWDFIIETKDGKLYRYEGYGEHGATPDGYEEFAEKFKSFCPEME